MFGNIREVPKCQLMCAHFLLILLLEPTVPPLQDWFPAQPESLCLNLAVKKSPSIPSIRPRPPSVPSLSSEAHLMQLPQEDLR